MNYYPLLRVRSWNNGMRCVSPYILKRPFLRGILRYMDKSPVMLKVSWRTALHCTKGLIRFYQSGRLPKVVALFSATNISSYIIELLQLHDTIQIKWNYARIHYIRTIRSHLMIWNDVQNFIFAIRFSSIFLLHGRHSFGKVINKVWYQACDLVRFIQQTHIYILHQTYEYHLSHAVS